MISELITFWLGYSENGSTYKIKGIDEEKRFELDCGDKIGQKW